MGLGLGLGLGQSLLQMPHETGHVEAMFCR